MTRADRQFWTVEAYIDGNVTKPVRSWVGFQSKPDADAFAARQREVAREVGSTHRIEVKPEPKTA